MKKLIYKLIFFFLVVSCNNSNSDNNSDNLNEVLTTKTITIEQVLENDITILRPVIIQTPNQVDLNKNYPVVFAYHGRGGSNNSWVNQLSSYTNSGEFIGIYPQGYLQSWNLGPEPSNADDVEFTNLIIEELQNYNNIDFEKIYAIGTSNGSGMVNKLGIHTSHFKAIAPVVSQLMESMPILDNTKPLSVYQFNGAADTTIPINGGPRFGHIFLDALKSAELWATKFECSLPAGVETIGDDTLYIFKNCNDNKEIRYLRVENGQHNLHKQNSNLFIDIWQFFKRF